MSLLNYHCCCSEEMPLLSEEWVQLARFFREDGRALFFCQKNRRWNTWYICESKKTSAGNWCLLVSSSSSSSEKRHCILFWLSFLWGVTRRMLPSNFPDICLGIFCSNSLKQRSRITELRPQFSLFAPSLATIPITGCITRSKKHTEHDQSSTYQVANPIHRGNNLPLSIAKLIFLLERWNSDNLFSGGIDKFVSCVSFY